VPQTETRQIRGRLVQQLFGLYPAQVMHALVALDVPDQLTFEPRTTAALATATGSHEPTLRRLLRAAVGLGLVEHVAADTVTVTTAGTLLARDVPGSIRNLVLLWGGEGGWRSWGELARSVRTGRTAFDEVMGQSLFDWHTGHPEEQRVFDEAMAESSRAAAPGVVAVADLVGRRAVVDVGGGTGNLLAVLLAANPELTGTLFDRPTNVAAARKVLANAGVLERADVVGGDFFAAVPAGADAYLLKSVLHDWDDEQCRAILRRVRAAVPADAVLLVVEPVLPETDEALRDEAMMLISDLNMLVCTGGVERTETEFRALLSAAGFALDEATRCPAPSNLSVLRARPV
jgi:predicted O-methyltransferase YrrM